MDFRTWIQDRWRWTALAGAVVCIISTVAFAYYQHEGKIVREAAYRELGGVAALKSGQIEAWRKERTADAAILSRSPMLREAIQRYLSFPGRTSARAQVSELLRLVKDCLMIGYRDVMIADAGGSILFGTDPRQHDLDTSAKQLVVQAAAARDIVFGDLVRCLECNEIQLDLAAPILDAEGRTLAVVLLRVDPKQSLYPLIESWPTPSQTAETLLVRREGGDAVVLNTLRFQPDSALKLRIPLSRASIPATQVALGRVGQFEGTDYRGVRVVAVLLPVRGSPWYMVAKVDSAEMLAESFYRGLVIVGFTLLSILLTIGTAANLYHRRQRNFYRQLHREQMERQALTAHYEHVVKYAHDAMILADRDMRIVEANDRALAFYEWDREELCRRTVADLGAPENPLGFDPQSPGLAQGLTFETRHRKKDGTSFPVEVSARVIKVDGERYYHEIIRDITDRKIAEAALKMSEEINRTTLYSIGDAVSTTDGNRLARNMNTVAEALTGWSEAEARGCPCAEVFRVFSEETGERSYCVVERVLRKGFVIGLANHSVLEARDGSRRPVEDSGAPIRDATGAVMGVVLVFRDVTNARAAENALVESEARYRELFENSPAGIYRTTPEGRILLANPALLRMLRYSSFAEMAGRNLEENGYGPGHSRAEFKRIIEQQGEIRDFEAAWVRRDGTLVLVRENAKAIRDASGATVYYDGIAEDITDRRRAEEERARLQLQLVQAQKMETIGRLAGGVAHDFNNLLTVINGYSALALSRLQRGDRQFHEFTEILRAGERAAGLVRQLLAFGRKQVLQPEVLDLNATVGNMEEMLRRLVSEEIEMVVRLDPAVAPVLADRHQIEQVVMNLAVNARDAMPSGGTMTLETGERHREGVCKRCHEQIRPGTYVLLTVRDTGMGMDAHTLEHLFEPFFTTKEVGKGTGLGLSTVQGIVIQSGGHVDVESEVDKGSAFHVYLPVAERSTVEPSALPPADVIKGGAETILLVEDQQTVREFVATILEGYGYRVVQAQDAAQALRVCAGQPVDLLVTDVAMPKMSGVELARRLRLTLPGLRTIFISGYSEDTHAQQRKSLPGAGFLQKPFSPQDLAQKVREVLEGR